MSGSLFERLKGDSPASLSESVRSHILRMLTTRQGTVQTLPDYGLPDINDLNQSRSELIASACANIAKCINKYEPRIENVVVEHVKQNEQTSSSALTMAFTISGILIAEDGSRQAWSTISNFNGNNLVVKDKV